LAGNILAKIQKRIRNSMNEKADYIAGGGCLAVGASSDVAMEYARHAGVIEGLALAERDILDCVAEEKNAEEGIT
tara:strand:+ start:162 stop:386 length:225 start_codon:yes stop_codon:yes gene_type:complete